MAITYSINKGVGKSLQFKGIKGQYIWWMGGGLVGTLVLFVILYTAGVNSYFCISVALTIGAAILGFVSRMSHRYGTHGLMKTLAHRSIPKTLRSHSRRHLIYVK